MEYAFRFLLLSGLGKSIEEAADSIYENCGDCLFGKYKGQFEIDFIITAKSELEYAKIVGKETTNLIRALGPIDFQLIRLDPGSMEKRNE